MARYDLSEAEWRLIEPRLPNKPRGVARVDKLAHNFPAAVLLALSRLWLRDYESRT